MAKIRDRAAGMIILCAMIAVAVLMQGCQKSASVAPATDTGKQTASAGKLGAAKPEKPESIPIGTADIARTKRAPASKPAAPKKPAQDPAFAPKPTALPKADIDSHDPKYQEVREGKTVSPKLEANGKPVTLLYLPPYMFTIILTEGGQEKAYLTFGTMTASSETGNRLEVHVLARPTKPSDSKFEKVAVIYSDKTSKGQIWTANAAGMNMKLEALSFGEWGDSPFPGSGMGWLKLKITAK